MGKRIIHILAVACLAAASSWAAPDKAVVIIGLRPGVFPEKDNSARLSRAGRREASRLRKLENEDLKRRAESVFEKNQILKQMGLMVVPFIDDNTDPTPLLDQVRGKATSSETPAAHIAVFTSLEWETARAGQGALETLKYAGADGHGGDLVLVFDPQRVKKEIQAFERVDRLTEHYVQELLTEKLGLHPGETGAIADRLKSQVRETLSARRGALKAGKSFEGEFTKAMSDGFVKDHLEPELKARWSKHDPTRVETLAHAPGERETAGEGPGHVRGSQPKPSR